MTIRTGRPRLGRLLPRGFQARLTLGFVAVVALTLALVSVLVIRSMDDYFYNQEQVDLQFRAGSVEQYVAANANAAAAGRPVVRPDNTVDPVVVSRLASPGNVRFLADRLGQANVEIRIGLPTRLANGDPSIVPAPTAAFSAILAIDPAAGQSREPISKTFVYLVKQNDLSTYALEVTLSDPYTFKASTIRDVTQLLVIIAIITLGLTILLASYLARRYTTPIRRLTEASRRLAEGDLTSRVPEMRAGDAAAEMGALYRQFNAMADQLQESVEIIRRDRDRSRDFLADVSHELRTPLAALRTFNELLMEHAGDDPDARAEFLESSAQQIARLDWLAQNLLELSKLDSGLVLLDLRPDDLRSAVESAVEQAEAAARRRGVRLSIHLPTEPVRIRHDPQRIGQVVSNIVGNALKFTPRSGSVDVDLRPTPDGAEIVVRDTGVGIDPAELPHIFDRFFRGTQANEARSSGSGLGLSIAKSIVDMHGGRIDVQSRLGAGTTFVVTLPRDPRLDSVPTVSQLAADNPDRPRVASSAPAATGVQTYGRT